MKLSGVKIRLRALEPEDLEFLYNIENQTSFWEVSNTQTPFSKYLLKKYLENNHLDIYQVKQLRLIITDQNNNSLGMIDLFDFNPQHRRVGVGILIDSNYQENGYASEALKLIINFVFNTLNLNQIYANIIADNTKSIKLFRKHNFKPVGVKKQWILSKGNYKDEILFQLIHE